MKPYGIPRDLNLESPDLVDIQHFGLKSSKSRCRGKSGEIKNSFRNSRAKRSIRRTWKGRARNRAKKDCKDYE